MGLLNVDGYYNSLLSFIDKAVEEGFISPSAREIILSAPTAKELMMKLEVLLYFATTFFQNHLHWFYLLGLGILLLSSLFLGSIENFKKNMFVSLEKKEKEHICFLVRKNGDSLYLSYLIVAAADCCRIMPLVMKELPQS